MSDDVVIGVDGGGTKTRAVVAEFDGRVVGTAEQSGASTEHNTPETARRNLRDGVRNALDDARRSLDDIAALTAGIAGLNAPEDYAEAERFLDIDALPCEPRVVNDAVVAHIGALRGDPGIVIVCGTGSIVLGVTADGRRIRNYDCLHYARAAARHLGEQALHALLAGETPANWALRDRLLDRWDCESVSHLREAVCSDDRFDHSSSGNPLDRTAPLLTAAAADGDSIARTICDDALEEVLTGVRLVGGYLDEPVAVAPAGSVLRSTYMTTELRRRLADATDYRVVTPMMSPVGGAVFDAIDRVRKRSDGVVEQITDHPIGRP